MNDLKFMEPGVYFDMSFVDYINDPSLSSSGIKQLMVAPETYWGNSALNPDKEPADKDAFVFGGAQHKRTLEGIDAFNSEYAVLPQISDYPNAIKGGSDLKAKCEELGLKKSGTLHELGARIKEADPSVELWIDVVEAFNVEHGENKVCLKKEQAEKIEHNARLLENIPEVSKAITGGYAEVSIFWVDPKTAVPMKARIDYLKIKAIIDLKTFSNQYGKPAEVAIAHAVANYRYYIQVATYSEAVEAAKDLISQGKYYGATLPPNEWLNGFRNSPRHTFVFLFIESANVPCIRLKEFARYNAAAGAGSRTPSLAWDAGQGCFRHGVRVWAEFMERFGPSEPWIDVPPLSQFCDEDFPMYMFED